MQALLNNIMNAMHRNLETIYKEEGKRCVKLTKGRSMMSHCSILLSCSSLVLYNVLLIMKSVSYLSQQDQQ
jgi:hypothetical protein